MEPSSKRTVIHKSVILGSALIGGFVLYRLCRKYLKIPAEQWLEQCPKIELHAHLHGSIRMQTLAELYDNASKDENLKHIIKPNENPQRKIQEILKKHKSFNEVFPLFDVIHRVVCSKNVLVRIINEVLLDFAKQNVKYLEIRSTPRELEHSGHSRVEYVDIILDQIREFPICNPQYDDMVIRFIVTIQNAKPIEEAHESLDIIQHYMDNSADEENLIVGIDFAPRPIENKEFEYYQDILHRARNMGLKITIHFAEYYNRKEQDLVLNFKPDRLGHAVCLKEEDYKFLLSTPIPIEMCATSNIYTRSIRNYRDHPFKYIQKRYKQRYGNASLYPMLFCTDDFGVFQTDLTYEWLSMVEAHQLTRNDVKNITMNAIQFTFASERTKKKLTADLENLWCL